MPENPQFDEKGGFDEKPTSPPLDKNQKIAAASLAVFAVLIVALWVAQLRNNIYGPFNAPAGQSQVASQTQTQNQNSDEALKNKDTDGDGLSDYDELNVYHTSPYLADTDSDGIPDGVEVKNGTDPNCPTGRTCTGGSVIPETGGTPASTTPSSTVSPQAGLNNLTNQNDVLNSLLNQFGATNPASQPAPATPTAGTGSASLTPDQLNALKNIDAASLRQLLIQNGMDKATLDKISDADLMKSYQETFNTNTGQ